VATSLDTLAHLVASAPNLPSAPVISRSRLQTLLVDHLSGDSPPGIADDPASQMFTEEILFSGGSYIVFPGPSASEQDILRWLLRSAVLRKEPVGSKAFRDEVTRAAVLCLSVSNRIARQARIKRGEAPQVDKDRPIFVPVSSSLSNAAAAVTISRSELVSITHGELFFGDTIGPLSLDIGTLDWGAYSFEFGQLHHGPFVKVGDQYIVPVPSLILTGLRHRILCIAQKHGVLAELVDAYHALILMEVEEWLGYWDSHPIHTSLPDSEPSSFSEGLYSLDSDKALYVQLATDNLGDFAGGFEPSHWQTNDLVKDLEQRATNVIGHLSRMNPAPNQTLILTILQPLGRWLVSGFGDPPTNSLRLAMSASDLRAATLVDAGDPLWLWKYARAHQRIRDTVNLITTDVLDEYALYRSSQHSYYFSDDQLPNLISIVPGEGLEIRKRVMEQMDPHGVPSFHTGYMVEVWSMFGGRVPIFSPPSQLGKRFALVVEGGLPIPVWIIGPESTEGALQGLAGLLVETLAYWIWQFEGLLTPAFAELSRDRSTFVIEIDFEDPARWVEALDDSNRRDTDGENLISSVEQTGAGLILALHSSLLARLGSADNLGERELIGELLYKFKKTYLAQHPKMDAILADSKIQEAIEDKAPLGQKKKMILLPLNKLRELDPIDLPKFRTVQEAEFAEILDGMGEHIRVEGWTGKDFPADTENAILNDAVGYLFDELEGLVAALDGTELLPTLVAYLEANTREIFIRRFTVPTRLACFGDREELLKDLTTEIPEADTANLANRFLIEYVAARPPSGSLHFTLETYDRLLALASEIINWGMLSEFVYFHLIDGGLAILPSGRLGSDRTAFVAAQRRFMSNYLGGFVSESQRNFASHWDVPGGSRTGNREPLPAIEEIDNAFAGEFGLSLTELIWLMSDIYELGTKQQGPTKKMAANEMVGSLSRSLTWEDEKLISGIDLLTLGPRDDFLSPPTEGAREVYPWRFNRAWSYLRRPLVRTGYEPDSLVLWGNRHIFHAMRYLTELCVGGRLKAKTLGLKRVIGGWRELEARAFEVSVADIVSEMTGIQAKVRLRKVGKRKLVEEGKDLGDIDVLGVIPSARVIVAIECKDIALARTPAEVQHQLAGLVVGSSGNPATVQQHLTRVKWVEDNLDEVLLRCFGIKRKGKWRVKPILVSDSELYAPYIAHMPFPAWSVETLSRMTPHEMGTSD